MSETCIEKYLDEYIREFVSDENAKKRMLDLYDRREKEHQECERCLMNCHRRIDDLEKTIMELGVIIGHDKKFIREHIG